MASEFVQMTKEQLAAEQAKLLEQYAAYQSRQLSLNMARGKPSADQLNLSMDLLDVMSSSAHLVDSVGGDCRNYGGAEGIPGIRAFFAELLGVEAKDVIVGGNSSLNMMFDTIASAWSHGIAGHTPWCKQEQIKFLCPAPGYDRHFGICEFFGMEMITVPMTPTGPDMDMVEKLVSEDASIKGIWCVPKYSNPQGITYSDETVRRFAALKPAAPDFRIFWDNAYLIHELTDTPEELLNIFDVCKENGTEDLVLEYCSTSKITFPGSGVAAVTGSENSLRVYRKYRANQTIGPDKINHLRHLRYFKTVDGMKAHMEKHKEVLAPRFAVVLEALDRELAALGIAEWQKPKGGYFVAIDVLPGTAKRTVQLCKECGVELTGAGATYPYKNDPKDSNIRLAPSFPPIDELKIAMEIFCVSAKLAAVEKLLEA